MTVDVDGRRGHVAASASDAANPELWEQTLFILNYDENDGLFDHVPPPLPPAGTPDEFVGGLPIGGGVRVACILTSPWTVGGYVVTENFDHTSVLQLLELVIGVQEPNISQWRRDTFGDLTSALGMGGSRPQKAPNLAGPQEENQTNHAGDFEQLKYKDSQFPGILEQKNGKEISATATHAWVPTATAKQRARRSSSGSTHTASRSRLTAPAPTSPTPARTPGRAARRGGANLGVLLRVDRTNSPEFSRSRRPRGYAGRWIGGRAVKGYL